MVGCLGCHFVMQYTHLMATHKQTTQMASTTRSALLRFELQMTEQSRKFGQRCKERRLELGVQNPGKWEQKHVVARLIAVGETAINTNQLSRYESGNGPYPREARQEAFAKALETTAEDLRLGPVAERGIAGVPKREKGAGPLDAAATREQNALGEAVVELTKRVVALETALTSELGKVRKALEAQQKQLGRVARSQGGKGK